MLYPLPGMRGETNNILALVTFPTGAVKENHCWAEPYDIAHICIDILIHII